MVWNGGKFSTAQQQSVIKTCNAMLKKRMKAFPDFRNYLVALISFSNSTQPQESFMSWQTSIEKLVQLPSQYFSNYITTCNLLFRDNTLYESASTRWYSTQGNYRFEFDSLPCVVFPATDLICTSKNYSYVIFTKSGAFYPTLQMLK